MKMVIIKITLCINLDVNEYLKIKLSWPKMELVTVLLRKWVCLWNFDMLGENTIETTVDYCKIPTVWQQNHHSTTRHYLKIFRKKQ